MRKVKSAIEVALCRWCFSRETKLVVILQGIFHRMKSTWRHSTVWLLAALLFISSTGLSVHQIYCHCKGALTSSILCAEDPCATDSCCSDSFDCHAAAEGSHSCTTCIVTWVKADWVGIASGSSFEKSSSGQQNAYSAGHTHHLLAQAYCPPAQLLASSALLHAIPGKDKQAMLAVFRC